MTETMSPRGISRVTASSVTTSSLPANRLETCRSAIMVGAAAAVVTDRLCEQFHNIVTLSCTLRDLRPTRGAAG